MFSAGVKPLLRLCDIQLCAGLGQVWTALFVLFRLAPAWIRRSIRTRMTSSFRNHRICALRYRFCSRAKTLALRTCVRPRSRWWGDFPQQTSRRQPPFLSQSL